MQSIIQHFLGTLKCYPKDGMQCFFGDTVATYIQICCIAIYGKIFYTTEVYRNSPYISLNRIIFYLFSHYFYLLYYIILKYYP